MKISGIVTSNLPNSGHFNFHSEVLAKLSQLEEEMMEKIDEAHDAYASAFTIEDKAYAISRKFLTTDGIAEADSARDQTYGAIKTQVSAWKKFDDEEYLESALILEQSLKDYNIDPRMQLDKETGALINLIGDWKGKYAEYVEKLGLTPLLNLLDEQNKQVISLTAQRDAIAIERQELNLRECRLRVDDTYRTLIRRINALIELDEWGFEEFATWMNFKIKHYKETVMPRGKKKEEEV